MIVEIPVRSGKSFNFSTLWPSWYLDAFPTNNVILVGHGADFASEFGQASRDVFHRCARWKIRPDAHAADNWKIKGQNGGMRTFGVGGGVSGRGCELLIVDDIFRGMDVASSALQKDNIWRWFLADAYSRLEPGGKILSVLSRRARDDLSGRILQNEEMGGDNWIRLRLPAICDDENDPLGRKIGEALWPAKYPIEVLEKTKANYEASGMGWLFQSLFQQNPMADPRERDWDESYFDDFWVDEFPKDGLKWRILSNDPSKGKSKKSDYCALVDLRLYENGMIYADCSMTRMPYEQIEDTIIRRLENARPIPYSGCIIETNGEQERLANNVLMKAQNRLLNTPIYGKANDKDKIMKIREGLGPLLQQRRIKLIKNNPHNKIVYNQFLDFPNGLNDDGVDAIELGTQLFNEWLGSSTTDGTPVRLLT